MSKQGHKSVTKLNKKEKIFVWVLLVILSIIIIPQIAYADLSNATYVFDFENTGADQKANWTPTYSGGSYSTTWKVVGNYSRQQTANTNYVSMENMGNITSALSLCLWVNKTNTSSGTLFGFWSGGTGGDSSHNAYFNATHIIAFNYVGGATHQLSYPYTANQKYHYCIMFNSTAQRLWVNGEPVQNSSSNGWNSGYSCTASNCRLANSDSRSNQGLMGYIDQAVLFKNYILNDSDVTKLYNGGDGLAYPFNQTGLANISFVSRSLSDITDTSLFNVDSVNYTYQYNTSGLTTAYANYSINSVQSCVMFFNGTCIMNNGTYYNLYNDSFTPNSLQNITYSFTENNAYPTTSNLNGALISQGYYTYTLTGSNNYVADEIFNISNITQYNFYEPPVLSTGLIEIYYYNSTYSFSSAVNGNSNVHLLCTYINKTTYNHSHNNNGYGHQLCAYTINSSGFIGNVKVNGGGFLIRGNTQGVNITVTNATVRNNAMRTTNNGGATWSNYAGTVLGHVHQFSGNDTFNVMGVANYSGIIYSTSVLSDTLDISPQNPEPPTLMIPNGSGTYQKFINITWERAIPTTPNAYITNYTVRLYNNDFTLNTTLTTTNNATFNYLWNSYLNNLSVGTNYIIGILATQNNSLTSISFSETFNFSTNGEINISARVINSNASITTNTTFYLYYNGSLLETKNNTNGNNSFDIIRNNSYTIVVLPTNYTRENTTVTPITLQTNAYTYHYSENTFFLNFYNETSKNLLNGRNITIQIISNNYSINYTTSTGTLNVSFLTPTEYDIRYWIDSTVPRDYYTTLMPYSYQNISLFVLDADISQYYLPLLYDENSQFINNATVSLLRYYVDTNSYQIVEMSKTDTNGQAVLRVVPNSIYYKLIFVKDSSNLVTTPAKITAQTNAYTLRIGQSPLTSFESYQNLIKNFSYNKNTNTFVLTWSDNTNIVTRGCLIIYKINNGIKTTESDSCSGGSSGSIIYTITPDNSSIYTASAYLNTNTQYSTFSLGMITINFKETIQKFGKIGILIAIMIVLTISLMSNENGTRATVIIGLFAFVLVGIFGLIQYKLEAIIGLFIIAGIILYKLRGS